MMYGVRLPPDEPRFYYWLMNWICERRLAVRHPIFRQRAPDKPVPGPEGGVDPGGGAPLLVYRIWHAMHQRAVGITGSQ